jgi:hypothetical protein
MKLTYRGVSYEHEPVILETLPTEEVTGKYRGRDWRFRNLQKPPVMMPVNGLKYRGVSYNKPGNLPQQDSTDNRELIGNSVASKARSLMFNHTQCIKKRQQSMLTRAAMAIGIEDKTYDHWNRIQGKVHPSFRLSYDRFGATMS